MDNGPNQPQAGVWQSIQTTDSADPLPPVQPSAVWPPAPAPSAVWPPPPSRIYETFPFNNVQLRVAGNVSDFRTGNLSVSTSGIMIDGKAVLPAQTQFWILLVTFFIDIWIFVAIVFEYFVRTQQELMLNWTEIDQIVFIPSRSPNKPRVCVVYRQPDKKGMIRQYSLATRMTQVDSERFADAVNQASPPTLPKVHNGRLRAWFGGPIWYSLLTGWAIAIAAQLLVYVLASMVKR